MEYTSHPAIFAGGGRLSKINRYSIQMYPMYIDKDALKSVFYMVYASFSLCYVSVM